MPVRTQANLALVFMMLLGGLLRPLSATFDPMIDGIIKEVCNIIRTGKVREWIHGSDIVYAK